MLKYSLIDFSVMDVAVGSYEGVSGGESMGLLLQRGAVVAE